ncbi:hypothetical protein GCM10009730_66070 [Streptomyces albidochromogenes]
MLRETVPQLFGGGKTVAKPVNAAVGGTWICCLICESDQFRVREVKLNSFGLEFLKMAWADESATGLICYWCGYVHLFVNRDIELRRVKT